MKKLVLLVISLVFFAGKSVSQEVGSAPGTAALKYKQRVYGGLGIGLDYGGVLGAKIEYLPIKNLGLFGGVGFNLLTVGWDAGVSYKISPDKSVSPNLMVFYGCNGVSMVEGDGYSHYEMVSYGVTFGGNLDFKIGRKGNTWSIGLFVPLRSQKFKDNYEAMKNDKNLEFKKNLLPVAFSFGYNILINK